MKNQQLTALVYLTQGIGVVFFVIFLAAFYLPIPTGDTSIGDPNYRTPLSIFGIIFIIVTIISIVASYARNKKNS